MLIVVAYMAAMFFLSEQQGAQSNLLTALAAFKIKKFILASGLSKSYPVLMQLNYNYLIRKLLHFVEYFILAIVVNFALRNYKLKMNPTFIITLLFCVIFAISDEYHQYFITGRNSSPIDVAIDTSGSLLALCIIFVNTNGRKKELKGNYE